MTRHALLLLALLLTVACGGQEATTPEAAPPSAETPPPVVVEEPPVPDFVPNALAPFPEIVTGGQPTLDDLRRAADAGYKTVVNLRGLDEEGQLPPDEVRALGVEYVQIPINGIEDLSIENAHRLADALAGEEALPAIVHCKSGNRVGALFAVEAVHLDGASLEEALEVGRSAGLTRLEPEVRELLGQVAEPAPAN